MARYQYVPRRIKRLQELLDFLRVQMKLGRATGKTVADASALEWAIPILVDYFEDCRSPRPWVPHWVYRLLTYDNRWYLRHDGEWVQWRPGRQGTAPSAVETDSDESKLPGGGTHET